MKGKILNNNCKLSFINTGMGIKLSSFVKSAHKYSLINQFLAFFKSVFDNLAFDKIILGF